MGRGREQEEIDGPFVICELYFFSCRCTSTYAHLSNRDPAQTVSLSRPGNQSRTTAQPFHGPRQSGPSGSGPWLPPSSSHQRAPVGACALPPEVNWQRQKGCSRRESEKKKMKQSKNAWFTALKLTSTRTWWLRKLWQLSSTHTPNTHTEVLTPITRSLQSPSFVSGVSVLLRDTGMTCATEIVETVTELMW